MQKNTNCLNSTTHFYPKQSTTPGSNTNPTCDAPNPHEARHVHDVFLSKLHLRTPIIVTTVFPTQPWTIKLIFWKIAISKKSKKSKHNLSEPINVGQQSRILGDRLHCWATLRKKHFPTPPSLWLHGVWNLSESVSKHSNCTKGTTR